MKFIKSCAVVVSALLITACGNNDDDRSSSSVSFSVSDAPVESAENVVIAFDQLEFIHSDGTRIIVDVDRDSTTGNDYQQIDLLDFPGSNSALILTDQILPIGDYKELIMHIEADRTLSYVIDSNGSNDLKQPSNKLKLGGFTIADETVQGFTIEFDLRQSLVMRGNSGNNNGYILKPHGVTIIDNDTASSLKGTVNSSLFDAGLCDRDSGNYVYLYEKHGLNSTTLADNFDADDDEFNDILPVIGSSIPYASTSVDLGTGDYAFGFLPSGNYTVAFSCSALSDDPVQFDGLVIPDPAGQLKELILSDSQEIIYNFNP